MGDIWFVQSRIYSSEYPAPLVLALLINAGPGVVVNIVRPLAIIIAAEPCQVLERPRLPSRPEELGQASKMKRVMVQVWEPTREQTGKPRRRSHVVVHNEVCEAVTRLKGLLHHFRPEYRERKPCPFLIVPATIWTPLVLPEPCRAMNEPGAEHLIIFEERAALRDEIRVERLGVRVEE
jgi:hypothetical protein